MEAKFRIMCLMLITTCILALCIYKAAFSINNYIKFSQTKIFNLNTPFSSHVSKSRVLILPLPLINISIELLALMPPEKPSERDKDLVRVEFFPLYLL